MRTRALFYAGPVFLALILVRISAAWSDPTAGPPWVEYTSAHDLGTESQHWFVTRDTLGRLFLGSAGLLVHDGQSWRSYPVGDTGGVRTLLFGRDGRLWTSGLNEVGYFTEPSVGNFQYHSLIEHLPESERLVGHVWGSGLVGDQVYFIARERLFRWDGKAFQLWRFPGAKRLFPLQLGDETWFHHPETGLYRLTADGPRLEIDRSQLPDTGILGLSRDAEGLLLCSSLGFYRPGQPARRVFSGALNQYIADHRLSAYADLPDGTHLVGTLNGGMIIVEPDGRIARVLDERDHPAFRTILSFTAGDNHSIWCTTVDGLLRFDARGAVAHFGDNNGLPGGAQSVDAAGTRLYACNQAGQVYQLAPKPGRSAAFESLTQLTEAYTALRIQGAGLLLGRHGGIDYYDGKTITPVYSVQAKGIFLITPSHFPPGGFLLSEGDAVSKIQPGNQDGFSHTPVAAVPGYALNMAEDALGRTWIGTQGQGALIAEPKGDSQQPVMDPGTGKPFKGDPCVCFAGGRMLLFADQQVLQANHDGTTLLPLLALPGVNATAAQPVPSTNRILVVFKRRDSANPAWSRGIGLLTLGERDQSDWHELDVSSLESVGAVQTILFSKDAGRTVLWIGGPGGLLRLDYADIPRLRPPPTPLIRLDTRLSSGPAGPGAMEFPFDHHQLSFRLFTGDPVRNKDWLLQTRLSQGPGEWSQATARRSYDFTNLSEGSYRFEARTVNATGMTSEPAVFTFRILPPWYRSRGAYAGYGLALALGFWGIVRIRERQTRAQNERLETLVQVRTAELTKANAAKNEFLAGISHEIRNPMNGIIGIAETLRIDGLDAPGRYKFGLLRQCASHLSSLLEDILDLSKIEAGVIELETKEFAVRELVGSVAAMLASESERQGIPVEVAFSPSVPERLQGDPRRIRQILLNFVGNALKFAGRGQIEVTVWSQPGAGSDRMEITFAVSDDGPGISGEEQKKLFTRFERGIHAREGRIAGTGLGLALCRGLAERMGGRIWLESHAGRGACFYFSAPFAVGATHPTVAAVPAAAPDSGLKSALVVDDHEYNRIVLTDLLATFGYEAVAAADGPEALALAAAREFSAIFLDYDLPGMNGPAIARAIRALPSGSAQTRILATTAFTTPDKRTQCLEAGMDAFLGKPVTLERLRKALNFPTPARPAPPGSSSPLEEGLANLRLLAAKKGCSLEEEITLFLAELQGELDQLGAAVAEENQAGAAHYAHVLCGRCSFIYERETELQLRQIEKAAAKGLWPETRRLHTELAGRTAALRLRLLSGDPAAPPA